MSEPVDGIVINVNAYGATVRLSGGEIASASSDDVELHRGEYQRGLLHRREMAFEVRRDGRRPTVTLAPQIFDEALDEQIASYFRSTQEWESPDALPAAERHFLHKKRRAAAFESRQH